MLYSYEAKDGSGQTVTGSLEAGDERTAAAHVRDQGFFLMRLAPAAGARAATRTRTLFPQQQARGAPPWGNAAQAVDQSTAASSLSQPIPVQDGLQQQQQAAYGNVYAQPVAGSQLPKTIGQALKENVFLQIFSGVSRRDLAYFYRQFAALVGAGVPILQSFDVLGQEMPNRALRDCLRGLRKSVEAGSTLSQAMTKYPWIFPIGHRALVIAGEAGGNLDTMFRRIAESLELEHTFITNIKKEITQPVITICAAFLLPPLYMVVVQGQLKEYLDYAVWPLVDAIGIVAATWVFAKLSSNFRYIRDLFISCFPGIGGTVRLIALARFARTLSSLYQAGINMPTAVRYSAEAAGNLFLERRILSAIPRMEAGGGIVDSLMQSRALPPIVMSMLGIGEATGSIDVMMDNVANHFEQEAAVKLHQIAVSTNTLATIGIGIYVCIILVKFYTGYYGGMMDSIK
jgi:type IV pilus assembly protein PilC